MIPKVINYCWFGGNPLPKLADKCIKSWKIYLPEYEVKEWNESNYDLSSAPLYVQQAYEAGKWAFVSDYVRFDILYNYGGLYFDTDVEIIKPFEPIVEAGPFMGCETDSTDKKGISVAPGLCLGAEIGMPIYKEIADHYYGISFIGDDGNYNQVTVVDYVTKILKNHGLMERSGLQHIEGITIYPTDYFCPINELGEHKSFSKNTYSIHWYSASWYDEADKEKRDLLIKLSKRDRIVHLPNRIIKSIINENNYEKLKTKIKQRGKHGKF